jgi:IclR family acetate operon transcriptional repressor
MIHHSSPFMSTIGCKPSNRQFAQALFFSYGKKNMAGPNRPEAIALERALQLFGVIVRDSGRTPLSSLSTGIGLPVSTAYRFVVTLLGHGLVQRARRGHYIGGPALSELSECAARAASIGETARPSLRMLSRRTHAAAHLGVLEGEMVTYVVKEDGGSGGIFTQEGAQLEAYCSAIGKVLLAELDAEEREAYLGSCPFVALTANTITDPDAIRSELARVREQGFAVDNGEVASDLFCVAAPIRGHSGAIEAAVSISVRSSRPLHARPPLTLLKCVQEIEAQLKRASI